MGVKFFGQFLIENGVINREQLLAATQLQESRNSPLGAIAVSKGYLSVAQAAELNRQQKSMDRRFGELALEFGMMTEAQIHEVLELQRAGRIRIGEALIELRHATETELATQLKHFQADQAPYQTGRVDLLPNTPHTVFLTTCIDLTEKLLLRAGGLTGKCGVVVATGPEGPPTALLTVRVPFSGAVRADFTVSASRDIAFTITRRMLGSTVTLSDDLAVDALKEFCNVICGNVCAKLSEGEDVLEIGPPEEGSDAFSRLPRGILVPIHVPDGRCELRLNFQ